MMEETAGAVAVRAVYFVGAICIVLVTLAIGWVAVWKLMLSKMKIVRELLDLNPPTTSAPPADKPASFDERLQQYKDNPKRRQTGSSLLTRDDM
ncbi:hypothetical protein ACHHYP_01902 [Achlya hypogyna]|uniref:Uncharacterized protein n=1 Tax=Achlya hypogyna TaxID=1202772 RepID=A0A1V9Z7T0_ACHHY|nr:hypothetical protein ACHHYP_01902 [Achlya hypogyna]